jgi:hypothetical protein
MTELPGGTAGCDVCGVLLDAEKAPLHHAWHQTEDERLEGLAQTLRELLRWYATVAFEQSATFQRDNYLEHDPAQLGPKSKCRRFDRCILTQACALVTLGGYRHAAQVLAGKRVGWTVRPDHKC